MTTLPGLEGVTVARWLHQTITEDETLQDLAGSPEALEACLWEGVAPEDLDATAPWWITFTIGEARDVKVVPAIQVMAKVPVTIKVTCLGRTYAPIVPVYQRLHALLESQSNQPVQPDGQVLTSERVSGVQYPERTNGVEYRHLGGLYETHTQ